MRQATRSLANLYVDALLGLGEFAVMLDQFLRSEPETGRSLLTLSYALLCLTIGGVTLHHLGTGCQGQRRAGSS